MITVISPLAPIAGEHLQIICKRLVMAEVKRALAPLSTV